MIYLDNAATTRPNISALEDAIRIVHENFANPSSEHQAGQVARGILESCRGQTSVALGCSPKEVYFTSGGTEANNIALSSAVELGELVLSTHAEHPSVAECAVAKVGINKDGTYDLNQIEDEMKKLQRWKPRKTLAVSLVNPETGVVGMSDNSLWDLCQRYGFALHIDAVAAFMRMPLGFKCDSMSISAHKIGGLKGIGALYVREGYKLYRMQAGGHQERGLRPGTENILGIVHLAEVIENGKPIDDTGVQKRFEELLADVSVVNGGGTRRSWTVSNLFFPKVKDSEEFLEALGTHGVMASTKSACSSGLPEPSKTLEAMFGKDSPQLNGSIRFSFDRHTKIRDVEDAAAIVKSVLEGL